MFLVYLFLFGCHVIAIIMSAIAQVFKKTPEPIVEEAEVIV